MDDVHVTILGMPPKNVYHFFFGKKKYLKKLIAFLLKIFKVFPCPLNSD